MGHIQLNRRAPCCRGARAPGACAPAAMGDSKRPAIPMSPSSRRHNRPRGARQGGIWRMPVICPTKTIGQASTQTMMDTPEVKWRGGI